MVLSAGHYEREFRDVLKGLHPEIAKVDRPFFVTRAGGSQGADIIPLRDGKGWAFELKASHATTIHFTGASGRAQQQFRDLLRETRQAKVPLMYGYRLIGGPATESKWRLFSATRMKGVPTVGKTPGGNRALYWAEGLDLSRWVAGLE